MNERRQGEKQKKAGKTTGFCTFKRCLISENNAQLYENAQMQIQTLATKWLETSARTWHRSFFLLFANARCAIRFPSWFPIHETSTLHFRNSTANGRMEIGVRCFGCIGDDVAYANGHWNSICIRMRQRRRQRVYGTSTYTRFTQQHERMEDKQNTEMLGTLI